MSIGPMIVEVSPAFPWELDPKNKGYVRQLTVYCPVRRAHFVISENTVLRETLVFASDKAGQCADWGEVAGGKGYTLEEVLEDWATGSLNWQTQEEL